MIWQSSPLVTNLRIWMLSISVKQSISPMSIVQGFNGFSIRDGAQLTCLNKNVLHGFNQGWPLLRPLVVVLSPPWIGPWLGHGMDIFSVFLRTMRRDCPLSLRGPACFEQGSLPSLLHLPGKAKLFILPGDSHVSGQAIPSKCNAASDSAWLWRCQEAHAEGLTWYCLRRWVVRRKHPSE